MKTAKWYNRGYSAVLDGWEGALVELVVTKKVR